jgi:hypothetical protein
MPARMSTLPPSPGSEKSSSCTRSTSQELKHAAVSSSTSTCPSAEGVAGGVPSGGVHIRSTSSGRSPPAPLTGGGRGRAEGPAARQPRRLGVAVADPSGHLCATVLSTDQAHEVEGVVADGASGEKVAAWPESAGRERQACGGVRLERHPPEGNRP